MRTRQFAVIDNRKFSSLYLFFAKGEIVLTYAGSLFFCTYSKETTVKVRNYISRKQVPKGQLISKCFFGIFNSPQNWMKKKLYCYGTSSQIVFVCFLGELKTPKRHFEINWRSCVLNGINKIWSGILISILPTTSNNQFRNYDFWILVKNLTFCIYMKKANKKDFWNWV